MPIDPVTAKIIAQLAIKTITDEESRNKILIAVIVPISIVLLILSMFVYILSRFYGDKSSHLSNSPISHTIYP